MSTHTPSYTTPGLSVDDARGLIATLDDRLVSLIDLALTLKHIHWNVVGPNFIGVHEMLDPQHGSVQAMVDVVAERIATLGGSPNGTPGHVVEARTWNDYSLGRATTGEHLGALDLVYGGVIEDHRKAQATIAELDPVTEDILIGQIGELEQFHWFVRAHLENSAGELATSNASTEKEAAAAVTEG
jgi:starvation-inducible DNA-binding protein